MFYNAIAKARAPTITPRVTRSTEAPPVNIAASVDVAEGTVPVELAVVVFDTSAIAGATVKPLLGYAEHCALGSSGHFSF